MARLVIVSAPSGTTLQDRGRYGWLHAGVPPSGPLDITAHAAANLSVGNDPGEVAIEIPLGPLRVRSIGGTTISVDGEPPVTLPDGAEHLVVVCERAVRYLAAGGAFEIAPVLGSKATLLVAGLGGFHGRALRAGDALIIGSLSGRAVPGVIPTVSHPSDPAVVQVSPGPHVGRFAEGALQRLVETIWHVSPRSDRVGVRLDGPRILRAGDHSITPPAIAPPAPMVRGAIQITTDGTPIILGPDHPVTGGYPVLAVVSRASQSTLARLRAKRRIRFALADTLL
jgi:biotin-dependent carboxylase-like uncharacterized protein